MYRPLLYLLPMMINGTVVDYINTQHVCNNHFTTIHGKSEDYLTTKFRGNGDSCVYRIAHEQRPVRVKLYGLTYGANCLTRDRAYLIADGDPYGPFCAQQSKRPKRNAPSTDVRRHSVDKPTKKPKQKLLIVHSAGVLASVRATSSSKLLELVPTSTTVATPSMSPAPSIVSVITTPPMTDLSTITSHDPTSLPMTHVTRTTHTPNKKEVIHLKLATAPDSVPIDGGIEGIFQGDELNIIYASANSAEQFAFEWELLPENATDNIIENNSLSSEFNGFCNFENFYVASYKPFTTGLSEANDGKRALELFNIISKALVSLEHSVKDYDYYCKSSVKHFPCAMIRYPPGYATIQHVTGALKGLLYFRLAQCSNAFDWQWIDAVDELETAVGGDIPVIVIPTGSGLF